MLTDPEDKKRKAGRRINTLEECIVKEKDAIHFRTTLSIFFLVAGAIITYAAFLYAGDFKSIIPLITAFISIIFLVSPVIELGKHISRMKKCKELISEYKRLCDDPDDFDNYDWEMMEDFFTELNNKANGL